MQSKFSHLKNNPHISVSSKALQSVSAGNSSNPVPSEPIGGTSSVVVNTITTSLALLKEGSAVATRIPYIGVIAGLLLQTLVVQDEVKQCEAEWGLVMQKLSAIASIVINVGEACETHDLKREDLPVRLQIILESLCIELRGVESALKECAEIRGIKRVLQRREILRSIKQLDSTLSTALQSFQANVALDVRFAQINQGCGSTPDHASLSKTTVCRPIPPPSAPQTFFGRDAELARIIDMIFDTGSHPARIAILGPAGYGKTTLARAVLNNIRIQERYCDARYFVPCDSASSVGTLLIELGKVLGMSESTPDILQFQIDTALSEKDSILCFDNFDSAWDQPEDIKHSVEQLLSKITEFHCVTVLITMRGAERPAETRWTQPFLEPLKTLSHDAAENIWKQINGHDSYDTFTEELLKAVDYVPLAINLLAHLGQVTPSKILWDEWNRKHTGLIKRGQMHKLSDLEYSIQLSIDSERMRACPSAKDLLGVLSMLPDGMYMEHCTKFIDILPDLDVPLCLQVLGQCSLIELKGERYQPHSLICHFCKNQGFLSLKHRNALESFYLALACSDSQKVSSQPYREMRLEVYNTKSVLLSILKSNQTHYSKLIDATITLTKFHISIGDFDTTLLDQATKLIQNRNGTAPFLIRCLQVWGELYYYANKMENSRENLLEAESLCLSSLDDNNHLYGSILTLLGQICLSQHNLNEARDLYQKALKFHISANDILGQGNDHEGLALISLHQDKLNEAEASLKEALKCHEASDNDFGQGSDHLGLGEIYLNQNKLGDAEAQFQRALNFHKIANNHLYQGCDYKGLGDIYVRQNKLKEAEASFQMALDLHKMVRATMDQGHDYRGLGDVYFHQKRINEAESSYKNALKQYEDAGNIPSQGNAFNRLGHAYLRKSQLREAKNMFEKALEIHEQAQAKGWEEEDKHYLGFILSRLRDRNFSL